jgi:hypothetical protein
LIKGKKQSPSQSIATAIGQALIYTTKFPISLLLIGVLRSAQWGKYPFRLEPNHLENQFYANLEKTGIKTVIQGVGV